MTDSSDAVPSDVPSIAPSTDQTPNMLSPAVALVAWVLIAWGAALAITPLMYLARVLFGGRAAALGPNSVYSGISPQQVPVNVGAFLLGCTEMGIGIALLWRVGGV